MLTDSPPTSFPRVLRTGLLPELPAALPPGRPWEVGRLCMEKCLYMKQRSLKEEHREGLYGEMLDTVLRNALVNSPSCFRSPCDPHRSSHPPPPSMPLRAAAGLPVTLVTSGTDVRMSPQWGPTLWWMQSLSIGMVFPAYVAIRFPNRAMRTRGGIFLAPRPHLHHIRHISARLAFATPHKRPPNSIML